MNATISEKGQVTIPKRLREQLGLKNGTVLEFHAEKGNLIAKKLPKANPLDAWIGKGTLPIGKSADDYVQQIRDRCT